MIGVALFLLTVRSVMLLDDGSRPQTTGIYAGCSDLQGGALEAKRTQLTTPQPLDPVPVLCFDAFCHIEPAITSIHVTDTYKVIRS
jgi:hypothetical protein